MIIFGAIFFILLFETLIFVYFFPLIENITNTKLPMPIKIGFLLIQFIVLLWIYSQIILIFRGDLEQVRQNVTDVKKLIPIIDFEKYNFDQFIKNLDLSFRYNHILLIFGMIIYPMIAILVLSKIFRSLKITYLKNIIIGLTHCTN